MFGKNIIRKIIRGYQNNFTFRINGTNKVDRFLPVRSYLVIPQPNNKYLIRSVLKITFRKLRIIE
ncbi:hypothetical protein ES20_00490 [Rothia aeria]|nr:hypothetical protein ES20_00490 [Rothia aeria]KGJ35403.1 hypothetical protein ES18_00815 [Rothia aeria]